MKTAGSFSVPNKKIYGINDQTGTSYTLALTDAGKLVRCTNAATVYVAVPKNSNVAFPVKTVISFEQGGAGKIVIIAEDGTVTIRALDNSFQTAGQYSAIQIVQVSANVWTVIGGTLISITSTTTTAAPTTTTTTAPITTTTTTAA